MSSITLMQASGEKRPPDNWPRVVIIALLSLGFIAYSPYIPAGTPPSCQQTTPQSPVNVSAEEHYQRALRLVARGEESKARVEFRAAWEQTPGEDKYVYGLTMFYIHHQEFDQVAAVLKDHVARRGQTSLGYTLQGELFFKQKQYALAYESLGRALELSGNQGYRAHELIGLIYIEHRRYKEAMRELQIAAEQEPKSAQARYYHGRMCYENGYYTRARDEFTACLELQPAYPRALENLGLCFEALGDFPKALDSYRKAIALEEAKNGRKNAEPFAYCGRLLLDRQQIEEALQVLRRAVAVSPGSFLVNYELGRGLLKLGQFEDAKHFLLVAKDLDPKFPQTYYLLGKICQRQQQPKAAAQYWATFQQLNRNAENREIPITDR